jgi:hypothetical protein
MLGPFRVDQYCLNVLNFPRHGHFGRLAIYELAISELPVECLDAAGLNYFGKQSKLLFLIKTRVFLFFFLVIHLSV